MNGALYFFSNTAFQSIALNQGCDFKSLIDFIPILWTGYFLNKLLSKSIH